MKNIILSIIALFALSLSYGQVQVRKSSLAPVGGSATQGSTRIIYAGGELANREASQGATHLSEGFIGPDLAAIMGVEDYQILEGVSLYPNPVETDLQINLPEDRTYEVYVHDLTGKEVMHLRFTGDHLRLNMAALKPGMYLVSVIDRESRQFTTRKVQKK